MALSVLNCWDGQGIHAKDLSWPLAFSDRLI